MTWLQLEAGSWRISVSPQTECVFVFVFVFVFVIVTWLELEAGSRRISVSPQAGLVASAPQPPHTPAAILT